MKNPCQSPLYRFNEANKYRKMGTMIDKLRFKFRMKRETEQNALLKRLTQQTPSGRTGYIV